MLDDESVIWKRGYKLEKMKQDLTLRVSNAKILGIQHHRGWVEIKCTKLIQFHKEVAHCIIDLFRQSRNSISSDRSSLEWRIRYIRERSFKNSTLMWYPFSELNELLEGHFQNVNAKMYLSNVNRNFQNENREVKYSRLL